MLARHKLMLSIASAEKIDRKHENDREENQNTQEFYMVLIAMDLCFSYTFVFLSNCKYVYTHRYRR